MFVFGKCSGSVGVSAFSSDVDDSPDYCAVIVSGVVFIVFIPRQCSPLFCLEFDLASSRKPRLQKGFARWDLLELLSKVFSMNRHRNP